MGRSRQLGRFIAIGAVLQMLIVTVGVMRRSYMVIALPVLAVTAAASAAAFWVGWTMANTEPDLAELESETRIPAAV